MPSGCKSQRHKLEDAGRRLKALGIACYNFTAPQDWNRDHCVAAEDLRHRRIGARTWCRLVCLYDLALLTMKATRSNLVTCIVYRLPAHPKTARDTRNDGVKYSCSSCPAASLLRLLHYNIQFTALLRMCTALKELVIYDASKGFPLAPDLPFINTLIHTSCL